MADQLAIDFTAPRADEPMAALRLVQSAPQRYRPEFGRWLVNNWPIWRAFAQRADALWDNGRRHFGARCIGETLRYYTALAQKEGEFRLNDHAWPDCARLYVAFHPERSGFFELRSARRAA